MSHREHRGRRGFTRGELLVVIWVTLFVVVGFLIPALNKAIMNAHIVSELSNAKQIYTALFSLEADVIQYSDATNLAVVWSPDATRAKPLLTAATSHDPIISWPTHETASEMGEKRSSSEFFSWLVSNGTLDVTYAFFGGLRTGIKVAKDESEFTDDRELRNIWCIALDVSDKMPAGTPVLFTQNFKFKSRGPDATLDQMIGLEPAARPFGNRGGFVLQRGGAGIKLDASTATLTNFNPTGATNGFLWPLASGQDISR